MTNSSLILILVSEYFFLRGGGDNLDSVNHISLFQSVFLRFCKPYFSYIKVYIFLRFCWPNFPPTELWHADLARQVWPLLWMGILICEDWDLTGILFGFIKGFYYEPNTEKTSKVIFLQELIQSSPKNWPMEAPCKKRSSNDDCTFGGWGSSALPDLFSFQLRERFRWRRRRRIYLGQRINQV